MCFSAMAADSDRAATARERLSIVGYAAEDIVVRCERLDRIDDVSSAEIHTFGGGSAANVAAWAAYLRPNVRFIGYAGDDEAGRRLLGELDARGVEVVGIFRGRTPRIVCLVTPSGDKRRLVDSGGRFEGPAPNVRFLRAEIVHFPAFSLYRGDLRAQT